MTIAIWLRCKICQEITFQLGQQGILHTDFFRCKLHFYFKLFHSKVFSRCGSDVSLLDLTPTRSRVPAIKQPKSVWLVLLLRYLYSHQLTQPL